MKTKKGKIIGFIKEMKKRAGYFVLFVSLLPSFLLASPVLAAGDIIKDGTINQGTGVTNTNDIIDSMSNQIIGLVFSIGMVVALIFLMIRLLKIIMSSERNVSESGKALLITFLAIIGFGGVFILFQTVFSLGQSMGI